jgi:cytochrome c oxidase subunit 3
MWPPMGIEAIDPFELPLINTVILLASGFTVTYGHHYLINGKRGKALYGLLYTIILATIFTGLQGVEYSVSSFTISDGAFGSCFYFGTGLIYAAPFILNTKNTNNLTKSESKLSPY